MEGVAPGEPGSGPPAGFSLADYAAGSFGSFQEAPEDIALRFAPEAAADARRFLFHPTQTATDEPDGSLTVRFRAGGLLELVQHLFTWGDGVTIAGPERLRAMMVTELRRALAVHDRGCD